MKPAFAGLFLKMILKFSKKLEISTHNIKKESDCIFIILSYNLTLVSYLCIKKNCKFWLIHLSVISISIFIVKIGAPKMSYFEFKLFKDDKSNIYSL